MDAGHVDQAGLAPQHLGGHRSHQPVERLGAVTEYRIRPGSGGAGAWRGGDGVVREYVMEADQDLSLWWERSVTPAWGLFGGEAGEPPRVVLNPGTEHAREMLKANSLRVRKGDVLRCESGGGGGYGTPAE
ncbi:hydantoinase B/oxoprolinase family protein [Amycolatopsis sp. NPDC059021]|uniref:hydantoinase B/oxoprolinase family protein n=1 Tax=Amycolatopsis sp. NPDC059021 TaxID=3346704 RepID=UPI00366D89B3